MLYVCLFVCLSVLGFLCLDYSRTNEQIFMKKILLEGPGQRKELLIFGKDRDNILDTKKIMNFLRS